jgi:hypothetical protein
VRPNLSKITSLSIRSFLGKNPYKFYGHVPTGVENLLLETVTQVDVFYSLCEELSRPPTQEEFVRKYLKLCEDEIAQKGFKPEDVGKRIARAWATYIQELDFYCQLRDSGLFDDVILDTIFNAQKGYDLEVVYKGKSFYIHLLYYYKSRKEWATLWMKKKVRRKAGIPSPIEFPLTDEDADYVGNAHLYKAEHIQKLKQMLEASL